MADFPTLRPGDAPYAWHFNVIYRELERLRKMTGNHPVSIEQMDSSVLPPVVSLAKTGQLVPFWLEEGLGAGTPASPSSADCTLFYSTSGGPDLGSSDGNAETVYNISGAIVPAFRIGWGAYVNGYLYLVSADC